MEISNILDEYFLSIENNKNIEDGTYPGEKELINGVNNLKIWDVFNGAHFDTIKLQEYFSSLSLEERSEVFKFGISCFVLFVQINFTGPDKPLNAHRMENYSKEQISLGHDEINPNTEFSTLLYVSKCIFENCLVAKIVNLLWTLRSLIIQQQIMEEPSPLVLSLANDLKRQFEEYSLPDYIRAKFDLEFAQLYLTLRHLTKCNEHLDSAESILGVRYNFGGKLGKRTRYQLTDLAQMTLEVTLSLDNPEIKRPPVKDFEVPKDIPLKDDVRLDKIQFVEPEEKVVNFPNTEQKFLLTRVQEMIIAKPKSELVTEEILPFFDFILSQKNTWSVRVATLMLRCKYENSIRTISRKISQCEEILQCFEKSTPHILSRFADVFSTGLKPRWKMQADYAEALMSIGLVEDSLKIFLKTQDWEGVIVCYTLLRLKHKAAEVIRQQLDIKETPKMWCLLGDATDSIDCYEKAWELSKERSHKAKRHWGNYLFERKQYEESIPHFEKSLSINPLQAPVWLRLGFAALQTKNWQLAATAYLRYTHLEPEGFQAWNNLAQAFIKMGRNKEAHNALSEALKYNFDNWQIWENYLIVSCDIDSYPNIIQAYHKILDAKKKYINIVALKMLADVACKDCSDDKFKQQTRALFGRITSIDPGQGEVWKLYANLCPPGPLKAERFQKAFKAYTQPGWEKKAENCIGVLEVCNMMCHLILREDLDLPMELFYSMRLNLRAALTTAAKNNEEEVKALFRKYEWSILDVINKMRDI